jgi:hypothetical protein
MSFGGYRNLTVAAFTCFRFTKSIAGTRELSRSLHKLTLVLSKAKSFPEYGLKKTPKVEHSPPCSTDLRLPKSNIFSNLECTVQGKLAQV